ncbi:MAG: MBL fold metallo-hydrolase [Nitrospinota bacterium]
MRQPPRFDIRTAPAGGGAPPPAAKACPRSIGSVLLLLAFATLFLIASAAEAARPALCRPGMVRRDGRVIPVSWAPQVAQARAGGRPVRLRYVAHSSFLLTSPDGGRVLTDPYANPPIVPVPDAVTVSNFHPTHSVIGPYDGKTEILYGLNRDDGPVVLDRVFKGIRVTNFAQVPDGGGSVVNTLFVFQMEGLCIAHFGNMRFGPSREQFAALGKVHVLMIPIDGMGNVPHEIAAQVVKRVGPNIVIPMHYFGPELPAQFAAALQIEGITEMVKAPSAEIELSARRLPQPTVYMVMPSDEIP